MNKLVHAFTETKYQIYPAYLNISEKNGEFIIMVRSKESQEVSQIKLNNFEFYSLIEDLKKLELKNPLSGKGE